jgi:hypothetical protein
MLLDSLLHKKQENIDGLAPKKTISQPRPTWNDESEEEEMPFDDEAFGDEHVSSK